MVDIKPEFMVFLAVSIAWIVYTIFYNSQIVALILSAFIRRFFVPKHDYFRLDSVTINLLGGKIQFRGLHYANRDMYFRGATGYLLIRYWAGRWNEDGHVKPYDDDCRVSVRVDGAAVSKQKKGRLYNKFANGFSLAVSSASPQTATTYFVLSHPRTHATVLADTHTHLCPRPTLSHLHPHIYSHTQYVHKYIHSWLFLFLFFLYIIKIDSYVQQRCEVRRTQGIVTGKEKKKLTIMIKI